MDLPYTKQGGNFMFRALFAAAVAAALIAVPAYAKSTAVTLKGEVGPGFSIEVEKAGRDLKTVKAGTYKIKVEDKSSIHNFHLIGPGLNKKTGVGFKGETTWTIKLKPGKYTYQCDPHVFSGMKGSFRVTR
jgi:plastocyanin